MGGVSLVTRAVRSIGVMAGIGVSAVTVVSVPLGLYVLTSSWMGELLGGYLPYFELPAVLEEGLAGSPLLSWRGMPLPPVPDWAWVAESTLTLLAPLLLLLALLHLLVPMRRRIRNVTGTRARLIDREDPLQVFVDRLKSDSRGPRARVWVVPLDGVQAFALSGALAGHAIVIHQGALNCLPPAMVEWVLAHEYGHILHGDTRSRSLWILAMRSVHIFDYWRHVIANLALRLIHEIPLLRLLVMPTAVVIRMLSLVGRIGRRTGALVFRLFDTWASRQMEFAADRYAAEVAGPEAGIAFFEGVIGEWEPRFKGLLATHPRAADRAQRLREMRRRS